MNNIRTALPLFLILLITSGCNSDITTEADADTPVNKTGNMPHLAFSDLTSGPSSGLNDGKGIGTIVTVWGFNLNAVQGDSVVELCNVNNQCTDAAYIYYWKNADGQLPGGPANLYESHGMQEVSFSIPNVEEGDWTIKLTTVNGTSSLPFTVRTGNIFHVATGGDNANDCSFSTPCEYINGNIHSSARGTGLANKRLVAGDIVYSHGVQEPTFDNTIEAGMFIRAVMGTEIAPVALVAYPDANNYSTITSANRGVNAYVSEGIIIAKYSIAVGYADPTAPISAGNSSYSNFHIGATKNGRSIANLLIQKPNTCFTGWSGAITAGGEGGQNFKIFGNHIKDLGCDNSSRFQHTIYMSIRSEDSVITKPWEIAYNYLDNNNVFYGIHNYDESYSGDCGQITGTLKIHNNVVLNQRGAGINIGTSDLSAPKIACWGMDIEIVNNVLINVGLGIPQENNVANSGAIRIGGDLSGERLTIANNTVYGHGDDNSLSVSNSSMLSISYNWSDPIVEIKNNAFIQTHDLSWISSSEQLTGSNNSFWSTATNDANTPYPLDNNITEDPKITVQGAKITLAEDSPLINTGTNPASLLDIYGQTRETSVGAVQE